MMPCAMMMMALNKRHDGCIKGTKSDRFIATPSCSVGACAVGGHIGGSRPFQPLVSSHSQFLYITKTLYSMFNCTKRVFL
jgi:hypothetical protein